VVEGLGLKELGGKKAGSEKGKKISRQNKSK
jgi:hypothetical protein